MSGRRIVGLVLVALGIVALAWGGVFWTDRDTSWTRGPSRSHPQQREGFRVPPAVGIIAVIGGIALLVAPDRRRA